MVALYSISLVVFRTTTGLTILLSTMNQHATPPEQEPRRALRIMIMMGGRFNNAVAEYAVKLGCMLSKQGHTVLFVGAPESPATKKAQASSIQRVESITLSTANPMKMCSEALRFTRLLREFKPDLINTHKSNDHTYVRIVAPRYASRLIRTRSEPHAPGASFINRLLYSNAAGYIACANFIRDRHLPKLGIAPDAISVIRPGIDVDKFRDGAPKRAEARRLLGLEDTLWIGMIARFTQVKAHRVALKAYADVIQKEFPHSKLLFSGVEYDVRITELQDYAEELGIADRVHFIPGKVEDVRVALKALNVLLIPSVASESIARIAMEALALGVPTVGTGVNSVPEVIGDTGFIVPPHDPIALGNATVRTLQDKELRMRAREQGPIRMKRRYDPATLLHLTEEYFYRALSAHSREA